MYWQTDKVNNRKQKGHKREKYKNKEREGYDKRQKISTENHFSFIQTDGRTDKVNSRVSYQ